MRQCVNMPAPLMSCDRKTQGKKKKKHKKRKDEGNQEAITALSLNQTLPRDIAMSQLKCRVCRKNERRRERER